MNDYFTRQTDHHHSTKHIAFCADVVSGQRTESAQEATKRQYKFLFSHLKELLKLYINFFYRFFISCLVPEIFSLEVMRCPTS
jgi:hypothetical protein